MDSIVGMLYTGGPESNVKPGTEDMASSNECWKKIVLNAVGHLNMYVFFILVIKKKQKKSFVIFAL